MTGYPWKTGDELLAPDLNAAIVAASSGVASGGPFLPLSGGQMSGPLRHTFAQPAATAATLGWLTGTQSFGGTVTGAFAPMNILQITDSLAAASGIGAGLLIQLNTGGSAVKGGRNAIHADMVVAATTGNTNGQYTGLTANAFLPTGISEPHGIIYGMNATAQLFTGASLGTNGNIVGMEINAGAQSGTTYGGCIGLQIVPFGNWTATGNTGDIALLFGDQGQSSGWDYFISIAGVNAGRYGAKTTATLLGAQTTGTLRRGIDLSNITFTDLAWYSTTFQVLGATNGQGASIATQAGIELGYGIAAGNPINITTANGSNIVIAPGGSANTQVSGPARFNGTVGFNNTAPIAKPAVTGSKGANVALASLLTALANYGLVTDSST